jgi:hypothetical protein
LKSSDEIYIPDEYFNEASEKRSQPKCPLANPAEPAHGQHLVDAHRGEAEETD